MQNSFLRPLAPLCLSLSLVFTAGAADKTTRIIVSAGDFDRLQTVVTFQAPASLRGNFTLNGSGVEAIPLQVDDTGRAAYVEPGLKKGASKTYSLRPPTKTATAVTTRKEGQVLDVSAGGKTIFQYQMEPGPVPTGVPDMFRHGAHLHPVFSPSGKLVTGNHPPDHRWHRGIWFAWTDTDFEGRHPDFWNMGKEKDGQLTGEIRFDKLVQTWSGPVQGGFISQHRLIDHTSGAEKDVLRETWNVIAFLAVGGPKPIFVFDLVSTQTCAGNQPLKLPKYHYGGLGVRGNALWDPTEKVTVLTSEGHDRKAGDTTKGKWVHMGGEVDGGLTGIAVLIHPDNFRFPQPLRLNPKNPQLCIAPSQDGDWEITPGKPYVSRYRFIVADGAPDAKQLDRLWNDFAHPPQVKVE